MYVVHLPSSKVMGRRKEDQNKGDDEEEQEQQQLRKALEMLKTARCEQLHHEIADYQGNFHALGLISLAFGWNHPLISWDGWMESSDSAQFRKIFSEGIRQKILIMNDGEQLSFEKIADWIERNFPFSS
jgi:hypothetical protein